MTLIKTKRNKSIFSIAPSWVWALLFLAIGIFARLWRFGEIPGDTHMDEAFAGYEAYSLLHYGMDSQGYAFPVYLNTWGSGMSALPSYLMIPFLALFGCHTWVIRLPQVIVGCLSMWTVYLIVKRVMNEDAALFALFFIAICPWHILMNRWALDCNMVSGFLIFGLYFFLRGVEKPRFFLLSALMYGLSLYCYATIWPILPLILLVQVGYCVWCKKIKFSREVAASALILLLLALPLMLFLLVNYGVMDEICTPFFSIPRLVQMRRGEFAFGDLIDKMKRIWRIVKVQDDYMIWNYAGKYGLFYKGVLPFFVIGLLGYAWEVLRSLRKREFRPHFLVLVQIGAAGLLCLLVHVSISRVNMLFIPMAIVSAAGLYYLCSWIHPLALTVPLLCYSVLFVQFQQYYYGDYQDEVGYYFCDGIEEAIGEALTHDGTIRVRMGISYVRVLFYSREPVTEYIATVQYDNYPSTFLDVNSFGRFEFCFDAEHPTMDATYVLDQAVDVDIYEKAGFDLKRFGYYTVASVPKETGKEAGRHVLLYANEDK